MNFLEISRYEGSRTNLEEGSWNMEVDTESLAGLPHKDKDVSIGTGPSCLSSRRFSDRPLTALSHPEEVTFHIHFH